MKQKKKARLALDILLTAALLFLTAYQVTGEALHEWAGIIMTVLVAAHNILNRKWYTSVNKGKYNAYRICLTVTDAFLLVSFFVSALSGMSMSSHAVPFVNGVISVNIARTLHLPAAYYSFALTGVHIGLHLIKLIKKQSEKRQTAIFIVLGCISAAGIILLIKNGIIGYMLFTEHFAHFNFETPAMFVLVQYVIMLLTFVFFGTAAAALTIKDVKE